MDKEQKKTDKSIIIFIVVCIIIVITLVLINVFNGKNKDDIKKDVIDNRKYLEGVIYSNLFDSDLENESYRLVTNIDDYQNLVNANNMEFDNRLNFNQYNYIYYVTEIDNCSEDILGVRSINIEGNIANIIFDTKRKCGVCATSKLIYFIPIDKNEVVRGVKVDFKIVSSARCNGAVAYKPILYLYPDKEMDINIRLEHPELLLTTYPKYNNGWDVHVLKDGSIYDKDNKYYYALYWDEVLLNRVDFSEGFYVDSDNAIKFLEEKLSIIGLNDRERNEFIMYWLPKLEDNGKSLVYFELTEEVNSYNNLNINPSPNSLLRVRIHIKKVLKKVDIKEEKLDTFKRVGFSAVEWGGTAYE